MANPGRYQLPVIQSTPPSVSSPGDILHPNHQTLNEGATYGLVNVRAGNLTFRIGLYPGYGLTYDSRHSTFDLDAVALYRSDKRAELRTAAGYTISYVRDDDPRRGDDGDDDDDHPRGKRYVRDPDGPEPYGDMWVHGKTITIEMRTGGTRTFTEVKEHDDEEEDDHNETSLLLRDKKGHDKAKTYMLSAVDGPGGARRTYTFDADGRLVLIEPLTGTAIEFTYPAPDTVAVGPAGVPARRTLVYNASGNIAAITTLASIPSLHGSERVTNADVAVTTTFTYNTDDRLSSVTDSLGRTLLSAVYDPLGRVTSVTRPGETWTYAYSEGTTTVTFSSGGPVRAPIGSETVTYTTIPGGTRETITDCAGYTLIHNYNADGDLVQTTDKNGHIWSYTHHAVLHTVTSVTTPLGHIWSYAYNPDGQVVSRTDPLGRITTYTYDANGDLVSVTDPLGNSSTYTYDAHHQIASRTDPGGHTTVIQTTYAGSRKESAVITDPEGYPTTLLYGYDPVTGREVVTDRYRPSGGHWAYTYTSTDVGLRQKEVIDPFGTVISGRYAPVPCGGQWITDYAYSRDGRCDDCPEANHHRFWRGIDPDTGIPLHTRDQEGYETASTYVNTWGRHHLASFTRYDAANPRWTTLACGLTVPDWDRTGLDPSASIHTYGYDCRGSFISETDPLGRVTNYTYDGNGNRTSRTWPNGRTVSYSYDAENRLTRIDYPDGRSETFYYDAVGNLTIANGLDAILVYEYDDADRVTAVHQQVGMNVETLLYEYDTDGNRILAAAGNDIWSYDYDGNHRMTSILNPYGEETLFAYASCCMNIESVTHANGTTITYAYDLAERVTDVIHRAADLSVIFSVHYDRDANGLILGKVREDPGASRTYAYDDRLQLAGAFSGTGSESYVYDARGNRTEKWTDGTLSDTYLYNAADEITAHNGETYAYGYADSDAILMEYTRHVSSSSIALDETSSFDYREKMVTFDHHFLNGFSGEDGTRTKTIAYLPDGMGRVGAETTVYRIFSGGHTQEGIRTYAYLNDFEDVLRSVTVTDGAVDGVPVPTETVTKSFTHGPGIDNPLSFRIAETGKSWFYGTDAKRDVMTLTDAAGAASERYEYDPWGRITGGDTGFNDVTFASREYDADLGLYYNRMRWYDPRLGRFTQKDLIFSPTDEFRYVRNDPVQLSDPFGLLPPGGQSGGGGLQSFSGCIVHMTPSKQKCCVGACFYPDRCSIGLDKAANVDYCSCNSNSSTQKCIQE